VIRASFAAPHASARGLRSRLTLSAKYIGRVMRAFEIDSTDATKIDFRKDFVDHCPATLQ
jgi:hypothetical protein